MKKSKFSSLSLVCNVVRFAYRNNSCRKVLVAGITAASILSTVCGFVGRAQELPRTWTWIRPMETVIKYRKTESERPAPLSLKSADGGYYKQYSKGILTAMEGKAYAKLQLWQNKKPLSPLVSVGLDEQQTTDYYFPCPAVRKGRIIAGWSIRKASSNGCNKKVIAYLSGYGGNKSLDSRLITQPDRQRKLVERAPNQVANGFNASNQQIEISPTQDVTLVLIQNRQSEVTVDVLQGEIEVGSNVENIVTVTAGNRYIYSQSAGSNITQSPSNVGNSQSVQKFLEPDGWSPEVRTILSDFRLSSEPPLSETAKELLTAHNRCRAKVGVAPLKWSGKIASFAQEWADSNPAGHRSDRRGYGENMAWGQSIDQMVGMWCDEQRRYETNPQECRNTYDQDKTCGHFTQVVWSKTTEVGCGIAPNPTYGNVLVCNYNPPGNYPGQLPY